MQKTAAAWAAGNRILGRNKRGMESDTGRYKIGDGVSPWNALGYSGDVNNSGDTQFLFEINDGAVVTPVSNNFTGLTFDTGPDGYTGDLAQLEIPPGLYSCWLELDFDQPAEDRAVVLSMNAGTTKVVSGPLPISSVGGAMGYSAFASGVLAVPIDGFVSVSLGRAVTDVSGSPADLAISYGSIVLNKIGQ